MMVELASSKARNEQKPRKRKPEDEPPLPKKVIKKTMTSSAADGYHADYDELDDDLGAEKLQKTSRERWLEDSILYSSDGPEEVIGEDSEEDVVDVKQREEGTDKGDEVFEDTEKHFSDQGIGKPRKSNQTWESNESIDNILYIYSLNEAVQLQKYLENLESEVLVTRNRTPWEKFKRNLCDRCDSIVDEHLQTENRRGLEGPVPDKLNSVITRPNLGSLGGFSYFLELPTLEELANKQRDMETLRIMLPIRQKFDIEKLEPELCKDCNKYRNMAEIRAPALPYLNPVHLPRASAQKPAPESVPGPSELPVPIEPPNIQPKAVKHAPASVPRPIRPPVPTEPRKIQPKPVKPAPASDSRPSQPPVPIDPRQIQLKVVKPVPPSVPRPSQPHVSIDPRQIQPKAVKPMPTSVSGPTQPLLATDPPQKAPLKDAPPEKAIANKAPTPEPNTPEETQPPAQAGGPKRKGPAPKTITLEDPQPPVQAERPKRKGPVSKQVAPKESQRPAPGGNPKKKDPTPGSSAPKKAESIQPVAAEKPSKKPGPTRKRDIPDPSPEPATQEFKTAEDHIEEAGPIQRVMGNLPEKPKGHDFYCAICYTNLTRMGSAKKLEHVEECGTTLDEVKVMTKAQAQAAKAGK